MGLISRILGNKKAPHSGDVLSITEAPVGSLLRVEAVATDDPLRSDRLASLGLVAGCEVVVRQRRPTFVLDVGETTLALDSLIARDVRVRLA